MTAEGEVDENDLTPEQRNALQKLIGGSRPSGPSRGADRFGYTIEIIDNSKKQVFEVPEETMPEELMSIPRVKLR